MGRARINLKRIANARARKQAFMQRRKGLVKKTSDFCTMCEAEACLIVYDDDNGDVGPVTWPQDPTIVHSILEKYERERNEKPSRTFNFEDFFENRKNMIEAEISRVQKQIIKIKYPTWDPSFSNFGEDQLMTFITMLDTKIGACDDRINMLKNLHQTEATFNFMQNMAQQSAASSNPSQLNSMKNSSESQSQNQSQLNPALMNPLIDNNGKMDFTKHFDTMPLDSTNQLDEFENQANQQSEFDDWINELVTKDDQLQGDLVGMFNQPDEYIFQNIPFQLQDEQQGAALHVLPRPPPPLDEFQTDYYNAFLSGQH